MRPFAYACLVFVFACSPEGPSPSDAGAVVGVDAGGDVADAGGWVPGADGSGLSWPARVDFGAAPLGRTVEREVVLINAAATPVTVALSTLRPEYQAPARVTVGANARLAVTVRFSPTVLSGFDDVLRLEVDGRGLGNVLLTGVGGGPVIQAEPLALDLGVVSVGGSDSQDVRISNRGTFSPPLFLGVDGQLPWFELRGANRADFVATAAGTYSPTAGLGQNQSTLLTVRLAANVTPGVKVAQLAVFSTDPLTPTLVVPLTADVQDLSGCVLSVNTTRFDFGQVPMGGWKDQDLVLTNSGTTSCRVSALQVQAPPELMCGGVTCLSGERCARGVCQTRPTGFSLPLGALSPVTLAAGQSVRYPLRFTAPVINGHTDTSTATVTWSSDAPRQNLTATLTGESIRDCLSLVDRPYDFGTVAVGCSSGPRTVDVYNSCPLDLTLTGVSSSGEFSITGPAASTRVPPFQKLPLTVRYAPTDLGPDVGVAQVQVWQGGPLTYRLALKGQGATTNANVDRFEVTPRRTDVLFVIDDSCSMSDKQAALAMNGPRFFAEARTATNDFHVAAVTSTIDAFSAGWLHGPVLTPTTLAVDTAFATAVQPSLGGAQEACGDAVRLALGTAAQGGQRHRANADFLRDDASLAVICVTDAPDQSSGDADYYVNLIANLKGAQHPERVSYSVVGPLLPMAPMGCIYDPGPSIAGGHAAIATALDGRLEEICNSDWPLLVTRLGQRAFAQEARVFTLTRTPVGTPTVKINGVAAPSSAWSLGTRGGLSEVRLTQSVAPGATVTVDYDAACQ